MRRPARVADPLRPSLFDPQPARWTDPATSWAAGEPRKASTREHRARLRRDLHRLLQLRPMTDDELAQALPLDHPGSVSKRRGDLVRDGLVVDTGHRRPTRRGRPAIVWAAVR